MWNSSTLRKIPTVPLANFDFNKFCLHFAKYGVVCIDGVEKSAEATQKLCEEIAPIHDTFFGRFWVFGKDNNEEVDNNSEAFIHK